MLLGPLVFPLPLQAVFLLPQGRQLVLGTVRKAHQHSVGSGKGG